MRIALVSDTFRPRMGGIETQVSELAKRLSGIGHEVVVLTANDDDDMAPADIDDPYLVIRSVWRNPLDLPVDPAAPKAFMEYIEQWRPDVVHLHMGEFTPVVQALLLRLRESTVPTVLTVHSLWSPLVTAPIFRAIAHGLHLDEDSIAWTGVSELVNDQIRDALGPGVDVRVMPNGVDAPAWLRMPVAHRPLIAVCATRFAPRKRVGQLISILEDVAAELGPQTLGAQGPLRVVIAGEGSTLEQTRQRVAKKGLDQWVFLPGRMARDELADLYARADVYLAPSVRESASIAGREARAAGLAVLTRSQSGLAEAIEDGIEGVLADTDDDFIDTLVSWTRDPGTVHEIQEHNRANVPDSDWSKVLPVTEDIYRWAIGLRVGAPSSRTDI